jgi:hypothetical protein
MRREGGREGGREGERESPACCVKSMPHRATEADAIPPTPLSLQPQSRAAILQRTLLAALQRCSDDDDEEDGHTCSGSFLRLSDNKKL